MPGVIRNDIPVVGPKLDNRTDTSTHDQLAYGAEQREETGPHSLHHKPTAFPSCLGHAFGLLARGREWLLDEHVLSRRETKEHIFRVAAVRSGDVDDVDRRFGGEGFIRSVRI